MATHIKKMNIKRKNIIFTTIGLVLATIWLLPFYVLLSNSFKTSKGIFKGVFSLPFGEYFTLNNYPKALEALDFSRTFFNSLTITIVGTSLIVIFSAMAGWMLVRTKSKVSSFIFGLFLSYILVPFQCIMLPLVKIMGNLNMLNLPGLIFMYVGFGSSMAVLLFHGFIKNVPMSLEEAAIIDGCNAFQLFFRIILPLLKPIAVTVAILNAMWLWNDYLLPSLIINDPKMHTIPLKTVYFFGRYTKKWDLATAGLIITIIPIIAFYAFAQKYIIQGIMDGAEK